MTNRARPVSCCGELVFEQQRARPQERRVADCQVTVTDWPAAVRDGSRPRWLAMRTRERRRPRPGTRPGRQGERSGSDEVDHDRDQAESSAVIPAASRQVARVVKPARPCGVTAVLADRAAGPASLRHHRAAAAPGRGHRGGGRHAAQHVVSDHPADVRVRQ